MLPDGLEPADLAACEVLLSKGSKSFSAASLLLPSRVRRGATVLYAFCRVADDLVDDGGSDVTGNVALLRARLDRIYAADPGPFAVDRALSALVRHEGLPRAPLDALLEGFAWDAENRSYETEHDLLAYATRVAGSVGVAMTSLMGSRDANVLARACDLGIAMQLTNIARDVGEDARRGRLYLPRIWMKDAGLDPDAFLAAPSFDTKLGAVVARLLARADGIYRNADAGIPELPRACRPAIAAARLVYSDIGRAIAENHHDSVTQRARVSGPRKAWLISRAMTARFAGPRPHDLALPPLAPARDLVAASSAP